KGLWRSFGACTKDLLPQNISSIKNRILVWTGMKPDPYDTYAFIDEIYKDSVVKPVFFFLLGDYAPYDKNVSWKNKYLRNLIRRTAEKYPSGIHPSFAAGETNGGKKLQQEKKRLEIICGLKMTKSRQHFLRLHFPENYQNLLEAGIQEDYTMGYPSHTGFRAGICTPYHFYDLKKETETSLKIIPFQVMDVTLRNYMNLNPEEALIEIETLMREVKNVGGTFSCIWHNESLIGQDPWNGYREVFIQMNHKGFEWANGNA
ncbi:MAG: polysaccharide deacetylase family protein, partial [Mariniphaga sp.]|nr:polysaccharide deacetylase family protein [Mariniphaga sp.]